MHRRQVTHALHVFILASLATTPVMFVINAQFFIGRGASGSEVLAVALIVMLGAPLALAAIRLLAGAISTRLGWAVQLVLVGLLASILVSQALYPLDWPLELQAPLVLAIGVAAAFAYAHLDGASGFVSALLPLPFIVLAFVLFLSPVSGLIFGGTEEVEAAAELESPAPVVVVVFDELPGHALMDARRRLDADRFPGFAALGKDAIWYRNATTSRSDTELAVPTLMTAIDAPPDSLATFADHPRSLFTLLEDSHAMHVSEPWTGICPPRLCEGTTQSIEAGGLGSVLKTIPSIFGYVSLPDAERLGVSDPQESRAPNRDAQVATFVEEIAAAPGPVLHLLHVLLPHKSWRYLPSGERYPDAVGEEGALGRAERWDADEWRTLQYEQRFLLQLRYTDRMLGDLLRRLHETGLYQRSLIVVAADHGASFRAGDEPRDATETNAPDILSVPLLIKLPGQRDGGIDDRPARTVDVVPTIADALGGKVSWAVDGQSLLGELERDRPVKVENIEGGNLELTPAEFADLRDAALERRLDSFGDGTTSLYAIGPEPELLGRSVAPMLGEPLAAEATIVDGEGARNYDPAAELVPARIAGSLEGVDAGQPLGVALNGRVAATTYSYEGHRGVEFSAMVPPRLLDIGENELALLAIEGDGDTVTLRPIDDS